MLRSVTLFLLPFPALRQRLRRDLPRFGPFPDLRQRLRRDPGPRSAAAPGPHAVLRGRSGCRALSSENGPMTTAVARAAGGPLLAGRGCGAADTAPKRFTVCAVSVICTCRCRCRCCVGRCWAEGHRQRRFYGSTGRQLCPSRPLAVHRRRRPRPPLSGPGSNNPRSHRVLNGCRCLARRRP